MPPRKKEVRVGSIKFKTKSEGDVLIFVDRTQTTISLTRMGTKYGRLDSMLYEKFGHPYDLLQQAISEAMYEWCDLVRESAEILDQIGEREMNLAISLE
jgi:hypothetical protein